VTNAKSFTLLYTSKTAASNLGAGCLAGSSKPSCRRNLTSLSKSCRLHKLARTTSTDETWRELVSWFEKVSACIPITHMQDLLVKNGPHPRIRTSSTLKQPKEKSNLQTTCQNQLSNVREPNPARLTEQLTVFLRQQASYFDM
jgi:hypothetical protein